MKAALLAYCAIVLGVMVWATGTASMHQHIWDVGDEYWGNPWAVATLIDAYFAFLFFTLWVFYKETSAASKLAWLVVVLLTGTMGMALYLAIQVVRLRKGEGARELLAMRRPAVGKERAA